MPKIFKLLLLVSLSANAAMVLSFYQAVKNNSDLTLGFTTCAEKLKRYEDYEKTNVPIFVTGDCIAIDTVNKRYALNTCNASEISLTDVKHPLPEVTVKVDKNAVVMSVAEVPKQDLVDLASVFVEPSQRENLRYLLQKLDVIVIKLTTEGSFSKN